MSQSKSLTGRRVGVLAADGFELVELAIPVAALRGTGAKVEIISLRRGRIRGVNLHEPARRVRVTKTLAEAQPEDYDGLLIPGGFINPDLLRQSAAARHFVRHFDEMGRPLATLCHGPWLLASAGLTRGRTMTSWPGIRDDLVNAGATWVDEALVHDRNWISSRGPQDMPAFVRAMLQHFRGLDPNPGAVAGHVGSSPQRTEPPKVVLAAMKWTPRPSLRTVVALGLVGLWALSRSRAGGVTELRGS